MSNYEYPKNSEKTLYIDGTYRVTMAEMLEQIRDHFGEDVDLTELNIEAESVKITGCNCCYDPSDYQLYTVVTRRG